MCEAQEQILSRGLGRSCPFNLALVGSFRLATGGTGVSNSGVRAKNPAAKSSTMKGAKALASNLYRRRCRTDEHLVLRGRGTLLYSIPRNRALPRSVRKLCLGGSQGHTAQGLRDNTL